MLAEKTASNLPLLHGAFISLFFVAALYLWSGSHNRNFASTVKKRFVSVFIASLLSTIYVHWYTSPKNLPAFLDGLGLRRDRLLAAVCYPLLLTMLLFLGPLALSWREGTLLKILQLDYWSSSLSDVKWIRNHVVAPFSEEYVYRACLIQILSGRFDCYKLVWITPLFFGFAHVHHVHDRIREGMPVAKALVIAVFQFGYTTLFGAYSAYVFLRTGHFASPLVVHAFCNAMGFPDFNAILFAQGREGRGLKLALFVGLVLWLLLLVPLTEPHLYGGSVLWKNC